MATKSQTCAVCGALITKRRQANLVTFKDGDDPVLVHEDCQGSSISSTEEGDEG